MARCYFDSMDVTQAQEQVVDEFSQFESWEARYKHLINLGRSLSPLADHLRDHDHLVRGCQSRVWMHAEFSDGKVTLQAESDAAIVNGLIAILLRVYSQKSPEDILNSKPNFIEKIGLNTNLSQTRANGLVAMIKQIHYYALAFQAMAREKPVN